MKRKLCEVFIRNVRRINYTLIHWIWRWRKRLIYMKVCNVKNTDLIQQTNLEYLYFLLKQEARDETQIMWSFHSKRQKNLLHSNTLNMKVKKNYGFIWKFVYSVKNTDLIQHTSSKYLHFLLKQEARDETQIMWSFYSKRRKNQLHCNTLNMKVKKTMDLHESFIMSKIQTWFNKQT